MLDPKKGLICPDCMWLWLEQPWVWGTSEAGGHHTVQALPLLLLPEMSLRANNISEHKPWVRLAWTSLLSRQSHLFTHPCKALAAQINPRSLVLLNRQAEMERQFLWAPQKANAECLLPGIHLLLTTAPGLAYSLGLCCGCIQQSLPPGLVPPQKKDSQVTQGGLHLKKTQSHACRGTFSLLH